MPTSGYSFADTEISVRFRAPYITSAINQQYRGILPVGIYEGFNPAPSVNPLGLDLGVASSGRSSAVISSLLDPSTHVTVHLDNVLEVDLSAFASKTVAIAIDASYAFPSETTATVNVYDLSTETPPVTACVLAEVDVPASGVIPAANITLNNRTFPWDTRGRDATPLVSAIRNGEPLLVPSVSGMPDFWEQEDDSSQVIFDSSDAETAPSGFDLSFRARKVVAGASNVSGAFVQSIGLPIPANRRVRLSASYWPVVVPTSGNPTILAVISDFAGVLVTVVELNLTSTTTGSWEAYAEFSTLPATGTAPVVLKEVRVVLDGVGYTAAALAPLFYLSGIDVQVEQSGTATDVLASMSGETHHTKAQVYEGPYPGAANVALTFSQPDPGEYETLLSPSVFPPSHTFHVAGNTLVDNNLTVLGSANIGLVFGNSLDTAPPPPALSLDLGAVNASAVNISKAGTQTRVKGTLRVDQAASLLGTLSVSGAATIGGSLDTITATTLEIGAANATEVRISKVGVNTIVEGNLIVEGTTFSTKTETVLIKDNYVYLNNGWTPASFRSGGLVVNYLPIATTTTVAGAYTTTTVETTTPDWFSPDDVIQISGSDKNDGLYVVASHVGTTLTLNTSAGSYYQTAFTAGPSDGATITRVSVSLLNVRSDGLWETSHGASTTDIGYNTRQVVTLYPGSAGGYGEVPYFDPDGSLVSSPTMTFDIVSSSPTLTLAGGFSAELLLRSTGGTNPVSLSQTVVGGTTLFNLSVDSTSILKAANSALGVNHTPTNAALPLRVQQAGFDDAGIEFQRLSSTDFAMGSYNRSTSTPTRLTLYANDFSWDVSTPEAMTLSSTGALLVGTTTNPDTAKLHVSGGSITHSSTQFNARPGAGLNYEWINRNGAGHTWYVNSAASQAMTLTSAGKLGIGIGNTAPTPGLSVRSGAAVWADWGSSAVAASHMTFLKGGTVSNVGLIGTDGGAIVAGGVGDNFGIRAENNLYFMSNATLNMVLTSSGSLGIGNESTAPLAKIDVKASTREVAYFRTTDTGVSNQIAFANSSNFAAGIVGTVSGTGTINNDVFGLGYVATPSGSDFTSVLNWRSNGTAGINVSPVTGVPLRIQDAGFNDVGLEVGRQSSTAMSVAAFNRTTSIYRDLLLDGDDIFFRVFGEASSALLTGASLNRKSGIARSSDGAIILDVPTLVVGGDANVSGEAGIVRAPDRTTASANAAGNELILMGGASTGSAAGGAISLRVSAPGAAGTTVNQQTTRALITSTNIQLNGQVLFDPGALATPSITFDSDTGTGIWRDSTSGVLAMSVSGLFAPEQVFRISNDQTGGTVNRVTMILGRQTVGSADRRYSYAQIRLPQRSGTADLAGGDLRLVPGVGTGTGTAGKIELYAGRPWLSSSVSPHAEFVALTIDGGTFAAPLSITTSAASLVLNNQTDVAATTIDIGTQATASPNTKTITIGNGGLAGSSTQVNIASASLGTTDVDIGNTSSTVEIRGSTVSIIGPSGAAGTVQIGNATGAGFTSTVTIANNVGSSAVTICGGDQSQSLSLATGNTTAGKSVSIATGTAGTNTTVNVMTSSGDGTLSLTSYFGLITEAATDSVLMYDQGASLQRHSGDIALNTAGTEVPDFTRQVFDGSYYLKASFPFANTGGAGNMDLQAQLFIDTATADWEFNGGHLTVSMHVENATSNVGGNVAFVAGGFRQTDWIGWSAINTAVATQAILVIEGTINLQGGTPPTSDTDRRALKWRVRKRDASYGGALQEGGFFQLVKLQRTVF